ncbi:MAG: 50S ribosomal protein L14e [Candidatus Odinarchaeota archaeon]|nr:50S ribosomal protein L14e [Candidatus Odinarchaeota archaeon]
MEIFKVGRVCVKTMGREAGRKCVIVDLVDKNYVIITGPKDISGVRRRRVNIKHLEPTDVVLEIEAGASDDEVKKVLEKEGKIEWMREKVVPKIAT